MRMWPSGTYPLSETVKMLYATGRRDKWQLANLHTVGMDNRAIGYAFKSRFNTNLSFKRTINCVSESTKEWRLRNECSEIQSFKIAFTLHQFEEFLLLFRPDNYIFPFPRFTLNICNNTTAISLLFYTSMQSDSLPRKNINYLGFWEESAQENVQTWDGGRGWKISKWGSINFTVSPCIIYIDLICTNVCTCIYAYNIT